MGHCDSGQNDSDSACDLKTEKSHYACSGSVVIAENCCPKKADLIKEKKKKDLSHNSETIRPHSHLGVPIVSARDPKTLYKTDKSHHACHKLHCNCGNLHREIFVTQKAVEASFGHQVLTIAAEPYSRLGAIENEWHLNKCGVICQFCRAFRHRKQNHGISAHVS